MPSPENKSQAPEAHVADLVLLVSQLVAALHKYDKEHPVAERALRYIKYHDMSDILRRSVFWHSKERVKDAQTNPDG